MNSKQAVDRAIEIVRMLGEPNLSFAKVDELKNELKELKRIVGMETMANQPTEAELRAERLGERAIAEARLKDIDAMLMGSAHGCRALDPTQDMNLANERHYLRNKIAGIDFDNKSPEEKEQYLDKLATDVANMM